MIDALIYAHILSLTLWFGGLFGYVVIVWPAIISEAHGEFPRALLVRIAMRTAQWIYLAMALAVLSLGALWALDAVPAPGPWVVVYSFLLIGLVVNNVYGTMVAWPRIMLLPQRSAEQEWFWFRVRMSVALVIGVALHGIATIVT